MNNLEKGKMNNLEKGKMNNLLFYKKIEILS